jgi:RsiW-degrading membrane proteinase PrsW (M82 family)
MEIKNFGLFGAGLSFALLTGNALSSGNPTLTGMAWRVIGVFASVFLSLIAAIIVRTQTDNPFLTMIASLGVLGILLILLGVF